jgi:eukaryotic-like serine/threonine-protein kinase
MSLGRFLISKVFFKNLLLAAGIAVVLFLAVWRGLAIYTQHGKHLNLPDFTGIALDDIEKYRIGRDFQFVVLDSIYSEYLPKGSVVLQDPPPNSRVKKNRKIYLTTVALLPEQVRMPDLVDLTFRQALSTLETFGLRIGKLQYIPDIAKNAVLQQLYEGEVIEPGILILKGSNIDLILGQGIGSESASVPFLLGLTQEEAHELIVANFLNVGANIIEAEIETGAKPDSTIRVYKQNPPWSEDAFLRLGQSVDLWYRSELEFDFDSLLQIYQPDTLYFPHDSLYFDSLYNSMYYDTIL